MANSCAKIGFNLCQGSVSCMIFYALFFFAFVGWRRPITPRAHCQTVWNIQDQGYKSWNFGETGGEPSHSFWRCGFFLHQHLPCNIQSLCFSQGSAGTSSGQVRATSVQWQCTHHLHNRGELSATSSLAFNKHGFNNLLSSILQNPEYQHKHPVYKCIAAHIPILIKAEVRKVCHVWLLKNPLGATQQN